MTAISVGVFRPASPRESCTRQWLPIAVEEVRMDRSRTEWDPSWDDDWRAAQPDLEDQIREDHPPDPRAAVQYYRYGFIAGKRHPEHELPANEEELYQDFMTGVGEPNTEAGAEDTREWFHRGWDAAREPAPVVQEGGRSTRIDIERS